MLGDLLERLLPYFTEQHSLTEIPRIQRFAVRPPLDGLLPRVRTGSKRNPAIAEAHVLHGYSQQEIAAHVGLHYSTVSQIVQRNRQKSKKQDLTSGPVRDLTIESHAIRLLLHTLNHLRHLLHQLVKPQYNDLATVAGQKAPRLR